MTLRCWVIINKNVFDLSNADCKAAMKTLDQKDPSKREDWITRVWVILSTSLHDDLLLRVVHIEPGLVHSLIREVETALQVHEPNEAQTLRIELYSASMVKDAESDLQLYVSYIQQKQRRLHLYDKALPDEEIIQIFLKGLHPIFNPLQVHFAIPGTCPTTFNAVVETVRKFSCHPVLAPQLAKLKAAGISQHMFQAASTLCQPPAGNSGPPSKPICRQFARGYPCKFGDTCRFAHTTTPKRNDKQVKSKQEYPCAYCLIKGHNAADCRKRAAELATLDPNLNLQPR
jgi:hypothetical protein